MNLENPKRPVIWNGGSSTRVSEEIDIQSI
jgi:hypothetical protein